METTFRLQEQSRQVSYLHRDGLIIRIRNLAATGSGPGSQMETDTYVRPYYRSTFTDQNLMISDFATFLMILRYEDALKIFLSRKINFIVSFVESQEYFFISISQF